MSVDPKDLTVAQLKSNLRDLATDTKDLMGPYLFWLRAKLKAQGARNDLKGEKQGFGPWVEANLPITRKTADTWANEWAIEEGLMSKPTSGKSSKGSGDGGGLGDEVNGERPEYFSINIALTSSEQEQWIQAWIALGEEPATRLLFDTLTAAAKAQEPLKTETFKMDLGELKGVTAPKQVPTGEAL